MSHVNGTSTVLPHQIDELTRYLFDNYSRLMTAAEVMAHRKLMAEIKAEHSSSEDMKQYLRSLYGSSDPQVAVLLDEGARKFYIATRDRILRDHVNEVFLNRCPKCGALARTPKACLCPSCGHTRYEKRNG